MSTFTLIRPDITASRHRSLTPFGSGGTLISAGIADDNYINVGVFTVATSGLTEKYYTGTSASDPYLFAIGDAVSGVWLVKKDEIHFINTLNSFTPVGQ